MGWDLLAACCEFADKLAHEAGADIEWLTAAPAPATGVYCIKLNTNTINTENYLQGWGGAGGTARVMVFMGRAQRSGNLTAEAGLLTMTTDAPDSGDDANRILRVGTDGKLRLYDTANNLVLGPTTGVISDSALTHWALITVSSDYPGNTWGKDYAFIFIDGSEDVYSDVDGLYGTIPIWFGEYTNAAKGADLFLDDLFHGRAIDAGMAPWTINFPEVLVLAQYPASSGQYADWAGTPEATDRHLNWDEGELPESDADTSYNYANTTSLQESHHGQTRGVVGMDAGATILGVHAQGVHRYVGGSKWNAQGLLRRVATDGTFTAIGPTTSWAGFTSPPLWSVARPGGGAWVPGDLDDLEIGLQTQDADHDQSWQVTVLGFMWMHYTATLDKATAPPSAARRRYGLVAG